MPTSPRAQQAYLVAEEQPQPSMEEEEQKARARMVKELCSGLDEEEGSKKEETKGKEKIRITIKLKPTTRRSRTRQSNIGRHIHQYLRGRRNIIWTILLQPLHQ